GGGGVLEDADDVPAVVVLVDVVGVDGGDEDVAGADEDVEGAVHAAGAVGDEVAEVVPALVEAGHGVLVRTAGDGRPQLRPVGAVVDGDSVVEDGGVDAAGRREEADEGAVAVVLEDAVI